MGFLDDEIGKANSIMDAVTGGNNSGAAAPAASTLEYERDVTLGTNDVNTAIPVGKEKGGGGDKANAVDTPLPTEFIHFSKVHADTGKKFLHKKFSPAPTATEPPEGHAIMFRDALQREAIMLHGFVSSCSAVVKEATASQGALQDVANMAGSLLGGGNTPSPPDASQLNTFLGEIKTAADAVKPISVTFPNTHETGKKYHETRGKYIAFCKSLNAFYVAPPSENPAESAVKGVIANVPGVGKWINIIMRYAFKLQNIYLAVYLQLREDHEKNIELAAHQLTIDAIKADYKDFVMTYPIWFKKPKEEPTPTGGGSGGSDPFAPVTGAIDDVKKGVDDVKKDIYDFFGKEGDPEPTPGTAALGDIFSKLKGAARDTSTDANQPPTGSESIAVALNATLKDVGGLPDIMKKIVTKVNNTNLGMLEEVYKRLMGNDAKAAIDAGMLLECGRRNLSNMVTDVAMDFVTGLVGGSVPMGTNIQGMNLSAGDLLKKQIYERLSKYTEPILKIAIGELAGEMEKVRSKADTEKAQTMEVFLGRLPYFTALMFRNTFFPIWNLVVEEVFGEVSPALKDALKTVNENVNKVKDKTDEASEYKRRAEGVKDKAVNDGMNLGTGGSNLDEYQKQMENETPEGKKRREEREKAERDKNQLEGFFKDTDLNSQFPVTEREADGEGLEVTEEIPSVIPAPAAATTT